MPHHLRGAGPPLRPRECRTLSARSLSVRAVDLETSTATRASLSTLQASAKPVFYSPFNLKDACAVTAALGVHFLSPRYGQKHTGSASVVQQCTRHAATNCMPQRARLRRRSWSPVSRLKNTGRATCCGSFVDPHALRVPGGVSARTRRPRGCPPCAQIATLN